MDFKGSTPSEACEQLLTYLGTLEKKHQSPPLEYSVHVDGKALTYLKRKISTSDCFGSGHIVASCSVFKLRLARDEEGWFRWQRIPAQEGILGRIVALRDAHWFPLLSTTLDEALTAGAAKPERKVLEMK